MSHFVSYNYSFYVGECLIEAAKDYLKLLPPETTTIVYRGYSGAMIASAMLSVSPKNLKAMGIRRNPNEGHSGLTGLHQTDREKFIIVDDFICTGNTITHILRELFYLGVKEEGILGIIVHRDERGEEDRKIYPLTNIPILLTNNIEGRGDKD